MKRTYLLLLIAAAVFSGCSKTPEPELPAADGAVQPEVTILSGAAGASSGGEHAHSAGPANFAARNANPAARSENARSGGVTPANTHAPGTRAAVLDTKFPASTSDVFRMTAYTGAGTPSDFSAPYFSDQRVNTSAQATPALENPQYYPLSGAKLSFYAWSPGVTPTAGTSSAAPEAAYTLTGQEDILWAADASGIGRAVPQGQPSLTFRHRLKRVTFRLVAGAGFSDGGYNVTSIKIVGAKTSARLNTITGALAFDATPTADLTAYADATGLAIAAAGTDIPGSVMFEPGGTFSVAVTAGGVEYDALPVTLTGTDAGQAGKSHRVTLTFKGTELVVGAVEIQDWTDAAGGTVDVVGPPTLAVDQNGILTLDGQMLFFRFGSVVGFTQGTTNDESWPANGSAVLFNPVTGSPDYSNYTSIPLYAPADWDANRKDISAPAYHNGTNVKAGKGDPCKLVGLSAKQIQGMSAAELDAYESGWRLPTPEEQCSFTGQTMNGGYSAHWINSDPRYGKWYYSSGSAGGYFPKGSEGNKANYLPAAGGRSTTGITRDVGSQGEYWSSTAYSSTDGYGLGFDSGGVGPLYSDTYDYGFGARCVKEPELAVDQNGILVLNDNGTKKMLFFQFGSVVGFTQEGDWAADKVLFNPVTGTPDYSSYTSIPLYASADYDAGRTNVSDAAYHKGANVKAGKGDPCKLVGLSAKQIQSMSAAKLDAYDSGWRLPTQEENLAFTGQTGNGSYSAHWTASDSRYDKWYYSSGSAGGYFPKGQESQQKNYLPAAGYRSSIGSTSDVGSGGYYWSGTANNNTNGYFLNFDKRSVVPWGNERYAYGLGARCVSTTP